MLHPTGMCDASLVVVSRVGKHSNSPYSATSESQFVNPVQDVKFGADTDDRFEHPLNMFEQPFAAAEMNDIVTSFKLVHFSNIFRYDKRDGHIVRLGIVFKLWHAENM